MHRCLSTVGALLLFSFTGLLGAQSSSGFATVSIESSTGGPIDIRFSSNGFTARTATVTELIEQAYDLKAWHIVGGPDWVRADRFTVRVTTAGPLRRDQMPLLMQAVLSERFQLRLSREAGTLDLFRLTAPRVRNLKPARPRERPVINLTEVNNASQRWEARSATMGDLAVALAQHLRAPVVDDTKLFGVFDFRLDFTNDDVFGNLESGPNDRETIVTALDKQLGLQLVPDKGLLNVYVIDRVSKPSTDFRSW
jgi:uncharacterized protein (TIGR03435 family)